MSLFGSNEVGRVSLGVDLTSKKMQSQISGIASKAGKLLAAALSAKAVVDFSKKCIDLGSDLAEVQNVVDVTFTSMNGKINEFAQNAAQQFGLSETMAKRYAGTFGAMAKAFGFAEKDAADMSMALTGLAGDVASFYNLSQDEAYTKLKSVFTGETESLKDLGVVMTQTALDQFALQHGFGQTSAQMSEQQKVALRYQFVLDRLSQASGDFARTSTGWANQVRILGLQAESFMANVGQGLINLLTPALIAINTLMGRMVQLSAMFKSFTSALFGKSDGAKLASGMKAVGNSAGMMSSALAGGTGAMNNMDKSAGGAGKSLGKVQKAAKALKRELMGFDQIVKLSASESTPGGSGGTSTGGLSSGLGGIADTGLADFSAEAGEASAAMEELTGWGKKLKDWIDGLDLGPLTAAAGHFGDALSRLGEILGGALAWGVEHVLAPLGEWAIEEAAPAAVDLLATALDTLNNTLALLKPIWDWAWENFLAPLAKMAGDALVGGLNGLNEALKVVNGALEDLVSVLEGEKTFSEMLEEWLSPKKNLDEIAEMWKGFNLFSESLFTMLFGEDFKADLERDAASLWDSVVTAIDNAAGAFTGVMDFFDPASLEVKISARFADTKASITEKWNNLTSDVKDKAAEMKAKISQKWSDISDAWHSITDHISDKAADMKARVATTWSDIKDKWHRITGNISDKVANMKAKVATTWNDLKTKWNNLMRHFKDKTTNIHLKFSAAASNLKRWINTNVIGRINRAIPKTIKNMGFRVPYLAQGGYVRKNTPQLAMIGDNRHQGEIVAPEGKLLEMAQAAAASSGGSDPRIISLLMELIDLLRSRPLYRIDEESLRKYFIRKTNQNTKTTGKCELMV